MKQAYLECGKIINTHGFRGAVKLENRTDSPEVLAGLSRVWFREKDGSYRPCRVLHASVQKQFVIATLEGISDEESANRLRETLIYAAREDIPVEEGSHFIVDLIGLPVKDADTGALLGEVKDIDTRGVRDLYIVKNERGEFMVPAVEAFIVRIDPDDAVYMRPIAGLLDGGAENV
ncbi:MAG: 16S rRNA processing protein RimM [Clostridia bacterium]|nr:16S rRNA processing protein RimM [Clostridia bacterium]